MKATLTFDLPEERDDLTLALNGVSYSVVIWNLDQWLRGLDKYENRKTVTIEEIRQRIREETDGLEGLDL